MLGNFHRARAPTNLTPSTDELHTDPTGLAPNTADEAPMSFRANAWFAAEIPCYAAEIPVYARNREFMSNVLICHDQAARRTQKGQIRLNFANSLLNSLF